MLNSTFLSDLSEAQCEKRDDSLAARNKWFKSSIATNLLFFDRMYMGMSDLLCNKILHDNILSHDGLAKALLCKHNLAKQPLLQIISNDDAPFDFIASKIVNTNTITESKPFLLERASKLDKLEIKRTKTSSPRDIFLYEYLENFISGLEQVSMLKPSSESKGEVLTGKSRVAAIDLRKKLGELALNPDSSFDKSQSEVWRIIDGVTSESSARNTLKRLSDLANQATMSSKLDAALSVTTAEDRRFMWGVLKSKAGQTNSILSENDSAKSDFRTIKIISESFPIHLAAKLSLENVIELRTQGAFPDLRKRLAKVSHGQAESRKEICENIAECNDLMKMMVGQGKENRVSKIKDVKDEYKVELSALVRNSIYSGVGGGFTSSVTASAFGLDTLSPAILTTAASTALFGIACVCYSGSKDLKAKYNLYRTAKAIDKII